MLVTKLFSESRELQTVAAGNATFSFETPSRNFTLQVTDEFEGDSFAVTLKEQELAVLLDFAKRMRDA